MGALHHTFLQSLCLLPPASKSLSYLVTCTFRSDYAESLNSLLDSIRFQLTGEMPIQGGFICVVFKVFSVY